MIDAHAHIFKSIIGYSGDGLAHSIGNGRIRLTSGRERQMLPASFTECDSTSERLIEVMDRNGIDHVVLMQGGTLGEQNDYAIMSASKYPNRFTASCTYDPYSKYAKESIHHIIKDLSCHVIKLECSEEYGLSGYHPYFDFSDGCFADLMILACDNNITIVLDIGEPCTLAYQPENIEKLALEYPEATLVIAHLGAPHCREKNAACRESWNKLINLGINKNVYFDISSLPGNSEVFPFNHAREYIYEAVNTIGADKLIFGSDYPGILTHCNYEQTYSYLLDSADFLSDYDQQKIFMENAIKVYGIHLD